MTMEDLSAGKLDQIREILVGEQSRENEKRITALERHFRKEVDDLNRQLSELTESVNRRCEELASIQEKIRDDSVDRTQIAGLLTRLASDLEGSAGAPDAS